jgi:osmotically-inducible protein OsmY
MILPSQPGTEAKNEALQASAQLLTQSLEDLHLAERVANALRRTGYCPLRDIEVIAHRRTVTLSGRTPSYYLKQVAQAAALAIPGVEQVRNDLEVGQPG